MSSSLQRLAPSADRVTILGLPITGLMGTEPALTIGGIIGFGAFLIAGLTAFFGWNMPPEWWAFFNVYGVKIAGAIIILAPIIQGLITRARVVSPATAATLVALTAGPVP